MKRILSPGLLLYLFFLSTTTLSQTEIWKTYYSLTDERTMAFWENEIWIGYNHGLLKFDTLTKKTEFFTKLNSPLTGNKISAIAIDSQGKKWIASYDDDQNYININSRLASYDGSKWTSYEKGDSLFQNALIADIAIDSAGIKWMAALDSGLISFDGNIWKKHTKHKAGDYPNRFYSVRIDKHDIKWFGCDSGLVKYDGNKLILFVPPLPSKTVSDFTIDNTGHKWITVNDGLLVFDDSVWTHIIYQTYFDGWNITSDSASGIWLVHKGNLLKYDKSGWTEFDSTNSNIPFKGIQDLAILKDGTFRVFSADGHFAAKQGNDWIVYNNPEAGLPSDYLGSIAADPMGNLWLGSSGYGLIKYDGSEWTRYTIHNSDLPSDFINPIVSDKNSIIWMGTSKSTEPNKTSVTKYDGKNWTVYDSVLFQSVNIQCITIDKKGTKWFGTNQGLLYSFNDTIWTHYTSEITSISYGIISNLASDSVGNIWFSSVSWPQGNNLGLVKFDGSNWTVYKMDKDISISSIVCGKEGIIWVGTFEGGLFRFDGVNWRNFHDIPYITSMAIDNDGVLWIVTTGFSQWQGGLFKFKDSTWTIYDTHNSGISSSHMSSLAIDKYGRKWITTNGDGLIFFGREHQPPVVVLTANKSANKFLLNQNYPNPFNPETTFSYILPKQSLVELKIFDVLGREVSTLVNYEQSAGQHKIQFNASSLPSGVYIYTLQAGEFRDSKKLMLLK
ncbi:MAG: T9SS type A sorting domain-containing protein [Methanococcaceae archaeon]